MNTNIDWKNMVHKKDTRSRHALRLEYLVLFLTLGVLAVGGGVYYFSRSSGQATAYTIFAECIDQFEKASEENKPELWQVLEKMCAIGFEQSKSSPVAPYLLGIKSHAQYQQNKLDQAISSLDTMLSALPNRSPLYHLYATKRALLKLESQDIQVQDKGINELQALSSDSTNLNRDQAQYYTGAYYLSKNNIEQAKIAWEPLLKLANSGKDNSPWAAIAQRQWEHISTVAGSPHIVASENRSA
jgi:tetratricopeptide (TPR) repeat protein